MSNSFDIITRGLRIGAFSGLAITIFALATDSKWLLEGKYFFKPREKGILPLILNSLSLNLELEQLSLQELKERFLKSLSIN